MKWAAPESWAVVVLAAGKGKRMRSRLPKVLHPLDGRPLLAHVLETARQLDPPRIYVVVGHGREEVQAAFAGQDLEWVLQPRRRGTGDAVRRLGPHLRGWSGELLVLYGDVPLLRPWTLAHLVETHRIQGNAATILTTRLEDPTGYGRILRDAEGRFLAIREHRDLEPGQEAIREINSGIGVFRCPELFEALAELKAENAQGEYYLTDTIAWFRERGLRVGTCLLEDPQELLGVNTVEELQRLEAIHRARGPRPCPYCDGGSDPLRVLVRGEAALWLVPEPFNSGHLRVVPRRHVTWSASLDDRERQDVQALVRDAERALRRAYRPQGLNLGYTSGGPEHWGMDLVPRWSGDTNFMPVLAGTNLVPETLEQTRRRLLEALGERG
jgi:CTP:molybdopterin cytidylyltransferase MocA/diadenosine tetraphosphate (Ap4A) HIT family hydrolase